MRPIVQVLAVLVVVPATFYFMFWVPFSFFPFIENRWFPGIISLLCAVGVGWYVWTNLGSTPTGFISCVLMGAVLLGAIGFCAGFFGPIILTPEANQGPLLGIFTTGPVGFLIGALCGAIYWLIKRKAT